MGVEDADLTSSRAKRDKATAEEVLRDWSVTDFTGLAERIPRRGVGRESLGRRSMYRL
jgi:hypothetical protein